jgi:hypothetical protein
MSMLTLSTERLDLNKPNGSENREESKVGEVHFCWNVELLEALQENLCLLSHF